MVERKNKLKNKDLLRGLQPHAGLFHTCVVGLPLHAEELQQRAEGLHSCARGLYSYVQRTWNEPSAQGWSPLSMTLYFFVVFISELTDPV